MIQNTFRVFVSSTFKDFIEERKLLNDIVLPEMDTFCKQKGYNFQFVDLRWGINTESAINQKTLPICLDEVRRCQSLSPKPNFLVMVGERYGWIPLPYTIEKDEFKAILTECSKTECRK